jgi:hypothetical protein
MPKRSNDFQHLIAMIEAQLASAETGVTESKLVQDTIGIEREIDVAVEGHLNGHAVSVAVETRNRSRPADIGWIDNLGGKYRHLPIDKVVAVSSSGFTKKARERAASSTAPRIETLTLGDALETDWNAFFAEVREVITDVLLPGDDSAHVELIAAAETSPQALATIVFERAVLESPSGHPLQSLAGLADALMKNQGILERIRKTLPINGTATRQIHISLAPGTFLSDGQQRVRVGAIRIKARYRREGQAIPLAHVVYGGARVAMASAATGAGVANFALVQSDARGFGISATFEQHGDLELRLAGTGLENLDFSTNM